MATHEYTIWQKVVVHISIEEYRWGWWFAWWTITKVYDDSFVIGNGWPTIFVNSQSYTIGKNVREIAAKMSVPKEYI